MLGAPIFKLVIYAFYVKYFKGSYIAMVARWIPEKKGGEESGQFVVKYYSRTSYCSNHSALLKAESHIRNGAKGFEDIHTCFIGERFDECCFAFLNWLNRF
jgi:hypothetical protein